MLPLKGRAPGAESFWVWRFMANMCSREWVGNLIFTRCAPHKLRAIGFLQACCHEVGEEHWISKVLVRMPGLGPLGRSKARMVQNYLRWLISIGRSGPEQGPGRGWHGRVILRQRCVSELGGRWSFLDPCSVQSPECSFIAGARGTSSPWQLNSAVRFVALDTEGSPSVSTCSMEDLRNHLPAT